MSSVHWIDRLLAFAAIRRRLFTEGFGDVAQIERLVSGARLEAPPQPITIAWAAPRTEGNLTVRDGTFSSPVSELPGPARVAHVRELLPRGAGRAAPEQPMYVVLAASGEEGFAGRTRLFQPMVEATGIGVLLLENPLYGVRRPPGQKGTAIRTVSEQVLMNLGMVEEGRSLLAWLAAAGHSRLGITGFSMGATMAAVVTARWPGPIAAAIFATGRSAVPLYTRGLQSRSIDFDRLGRGIGGAEAARERLGRYIAATDLDQHPRPRCPAAAVIIGARHDGYIAPAEVQKLHEFWGGSELRWLPTGHAGALMQHAGALRRAAVEAMERLDRAAAGSPS